MSGSFQNVNLFQELEYYSPNGEYAVRQIQIGPNNHFGKIEIVDIKRHAVLFTLPDEVTYVTGSEFEDELGWNGENDLYLLVLQGCINPINNWSTNEIVHISLKDRAIVERYHPRKGGRTANRLSFPPVGYIVRKSSDGKCYIQVSGANQITVYFRDTKCVFDGVRPLIRHPFLAKWSPNCNACCFMGEYEGMSRLIIIYVTSNEEAGMDAWNLREAPDRVIFEEREGMSDLCVPVLHGQKIYKRPFYYDDSIYTFKHLISRQSAAAEPQNTSASQPSYASSSHLINLKHEVKPEQKVKPKRNFKQTKKIDVSGLVKFFKFITIKLAIGIVFLLLGLTGIYLLGTLVSILKG